MSETSIDNSFENHDLITKPNGLAKGSDYPPVGQKEALLELATLEHQTNQADQDEAAALLEELEHTGETPEERIGRLREFIDQYCADLNIPPDRMEAVVLECKNYEDQTRFGWSDPDLQIGAEDVEAVRDKILNLVPPIEERRAQVVRNEEKSTRNTNSIDRNSTTKSSVGVKSNGEIERQNLIGIKTLDDLQSSFETLRQTEGGTLGALRTLLAPPPEGVDDPQVREVVQKVFNVAQALQDAVPGKPEVVARLLNACSINFAASQPAEIFSGFLTAAEQSDQLDAAEVTALREVLADPRLDGDIRDGRDVRLAGRATKQVIDPETGAVVDEEYLYTSPQNYAPVRPGVGTYMDGDRQVLFLIDSGKTRDITGLPDQYITILAEVWTYYEAAQEYGATGFLESLGAMHYGGLNDTAFNWLSLRRSRDIISTLTPGLAAGRDGKIGQVNHNLLRAQMRVLTGNQQALAMQSDETDTLSNLASLGLIKDGVPDWDVLEAFGQYSQIHYLQGFTRQAVQTYLHSKFPERVDPPQVA